MATVDGTDIPMGVVSLYARESQAQTVAMYKSFMEVQEISEPGSR